ncbi:hypothetical protein DL546_005477 [Coniochaeta pulveracea]|uniref:Membrane-bound alpha-1,6-mannosyltransferase Initiation-specific n=1 Tax=Coniochaeta pulveracea TaxID=177199 RepID=A0A420Y5M9_9PEZI|nr:hypothetical protein DL546_005477 [Coniochaeta pulveracea]
MSLVSRNDPGKLVLIILSLLVIVLILHQHNASKRFAVSGDLSESLQLIYPCNPRDPETTTKSTNSTSPDIPNVIHQVWKTADVKTYTTLPFEPSHDLWKSMFRPVNYTVKLWTDDDVLHLMKTRYPWLLSTYEGYPQNIQRADLARLAIVHAEGGIYADLDVYPRNTTVMRCLQDLKLQNIFAPTGGGLGLSNHFFMAERGSPLLLLSLYEAKRRGGPEARQVLLLPYLKVFWTTGPMMVTAAFRKYAWLYEGQGKSVGLLDPSQGFVVVV